MDTLDDIVPPEEPPSGGSPLPPPPPLGAPGDPVPRRRRRAGRVVLGILCTVAILLGIQVVVASQIRVPWVAIEPGSASPAEKRIAVTGAASYADNQNNILFLTVRTNQLSLLQWVQRARDPYVDIVRESAIYGPNTPSQSQKINLDLMSRSKSNAELVALSYLGYDVFTSTGVSVVNVTAGSAADGKLQVGDVVTAVDTQPTLTAQSLIDLLKPLTAGRAVTLDVEKGDGTNKHQVQLTLGARPDGSPGGFIGISTSTRVVERKDVPVNVNIDSGDVGGDSAGLAFTLSIIDELTPGSLTGGHKVAVTGTIDLDGKVGDVGGVPQKAVAARRAGAEYMIVPADLVDAAKQYVGDSLKFIPVTSLQEALDALSNLGGNARELALPGAKKPS